MGNKLYLIRFALLWLFLTPISVSYAWIKYGIRKCHDWLKRPAKPVPLPQRRRSLSETTEDSRTHAQTQSLLFKLPPELRNIVYAEILASAPPIHVWRTHRRLCSRPCIVQPETRWENPGQGLHHKCRESVAKDGSMRPRSDAEMARQERYVPLLSSCRRVYCESIGLLYSLNKFYIDDHRALLALPRVIPVHHFQSINALHIQINVFRDAGIEPRILSSWPQVCTALAGMNSLQDLVLALGYHMRDIFWKKVDRTIPVAPLLLPLRDIKPARFLVQIPPKCRLNEVVDVGYELPFVLEERRRLLSNCQSCELCEPRPGNDRFRLY